MLTAAQRKLLIFIRDYIKSHKIAPSFSEMASGIGLSPNSKSGIHRLLHRLADRGYIYAPPRKARALEVLRGPDDKPKETRFTPDEFKAIGYLRANPDAMTQILERCG